MKVPAGSRSHPRDLDHDRVGKAERDFEKAQVGRSDGRRFWAEDERHPRGHERLRERRRFLEEVVRYPWGGIGARFDQDGTPSSAAGGLGRAVGGRGQSWKAGQRIGTEGAKGRERGRGEDPGRVRHQVELSRIHESKNTQSFRLRFRALLTRGVIQKCHFTEPEVRPWSLLERPTP